MKRRTGLLVGMGLISLISGPARADIRTLQPNELMDIRAGNVATGTCTRPPGARCGTPSSVIGSHTPGGFRTHLYCKAKTWIKTTSTFSRTPLGIRSATHKYTYVAGFKCTKTGVIGGVITSDHNKGVWNCVHTGKGGGCRTPSTTCAYSWTVKCTNAVNGSRTTPRGAVYAIWKCNTKKTYVGPRIPQPTCSNRH